MVAAKGPRISLVERADIDLAAIAGDERETKARRRPSGDHLGLVRNWGWPKD